MGFISDLFSSPGDKLPSNSEMLDYMRSDRVGASPNMDNRYGSTNVRWDGDQATITQSLAPEYEALANQQLQYLQGGPQQLGNYSNPTLESLFSMFGNRVAERGGGSMNVGGLAQPPNYGPPQGGQMQGSGLPQMGPPQGGQMQAQPQQQQPMNGQMPVPNQPVEYGGFGGGGIGGMGGMGAGSGGGSLNQMINDYDMMQAQRQFNQFDPTTRR